jgi:hypothetical protein
MVRTVVKILIHLPAPNTWDGGSFCLILRKREVLGSNLGRDTKYPEAFRGFPWALHAKSRYSISIRSWPFPFKSLPIIIIGRSTHWQPTGWSARVLFPAAPKSALGPTQRPYPMDTGGFSQGVKRTGREADHSPPSPSTAQVKNGGAIPPLPHTPSWTGG